MTVYIEYPWPETVEEAIRATDHEIAHPTLRWNGNKLGHFGHFGDHRTTRQEIEDLARARRFQLERILRAIQRGGRAPQSRYSGIGR